MKNSDPKAYRKMLNKFDGSKHDAAQKLSLEVFAEHFKKLNTVPQGDTDPFSITPSIKAVLTYNKTAFQRLEITHYPSMICSNNSVRAINILSLS